MTSLFQDECHAILAEASGEDVTVRFGQNYIGLQQIGLPVPKGDATEWAVREISMTPL